MVFEYASACFSPAEGQRIYGNESPAFEIAGQSFSHKISGDFFTSFFEIQYVFCVFAFQRERKGVRRFETVFDELSELYARTQDSESVERGAVFGRGIAVFSEEQIGAQSYVEERRAEF